MMLGLLTVMILEIVSEGIFFKNNKFNAWKIQDQKIVANSLMMLKMLNTIHPVHGKKHLRA